MLACEFIEWSAICCVLTIIIMPLLAPQLLAFWLLYPSCFDVNLNCVVIGLELCVKEQLVAAWAKAQLEALYTPLAWQELFFRLLPDLSKSWLQLACILGIDSSALHHCWIVCYLNSPWGSCGCDHLATFACVASHLGFCWYWELNNETTCLLL